MFSRFKRLIDSVIWEIRKISPKFRARLKEHLEFDSRYGVSTFDSISLDQLDFSAEHKSNCYWYQAVEPWIIGEIFDFFDGDFSTFTIIDIGCGKGRVLIIAAEFNFKSIIGFELSKSLANQARKNIELLYQIPSSTRLAGAEQIRVHQGDALSLELPSGDLFLVLYNPFDSVVLSHFIERLLLSKKLENTSITIAYINPLHYEVFAAYQEFCLLKTTKRYRLYSLNQSN